LCPGIEKEIEQLMQSVLSDMFGQLLNKHSLEKLGDYNPFITSGPRYWGRYADVIDQGPLFLRVGNIGFAHLDLEDIERLDLPADAGNERARVQTGDVLVTITGTIGRSAVVPNDIEESFINQHVALVRMKEGKILPRYLMWFILSPLGSGQAADAAYGQTKPGLNLTQLRNLKLPVPPVSEQHQIVAYLDQVQSHVDQLQLATDALTADLEHTEQAILAQAFRGEL
jgi:type I restriction enzyme S subunit